MNAVVFNQTVTYLTRRIRSWDRRLRLATSLLWGPRGLIVGLLISLTIAAVSWLRPWLLPEQVAVITGIIIAVVVLGVLACIWLWPQPSVHAARYFDRRFDLKERMSTALELSGGIIPLPERLAERQLSDAADAAQQVNAAAWLPMRVRIREILAAAALAALVAYLLLANNPQADKLLRQRNMQNALHTQINGLEQTVEQIESSDALSPAEKEMLAEPINEALGVLTQPNITQQEAVAALAEASQSLKDLSDGLSPEQQAAYQQAAVGMASSQTPSDLAESFSKPNLDEAATATENLANDLNKLDTAESQQSLAEQLEQAAAALEQSNPDLAGKYREAAEALLRGDQKAAEQALRDAAEMLREQQDQLQQSPQAQAAQSAQAQVEQSQQELAQAGQESSANQNPSSQQSMSASQQQQMGGQSQSGQMQSGQMFGSESQQGQGQNQGGQQGLQSAVSQQNPGTDAGQASLPGAESQNETGQSLGSSAGQEQNSGQGSNSDSTGQFGVAGAGAGEGQGGAGSDTTTGIQPAENQGQIPTNNASNANGQLQDYIPYHGPSTLGGQSNQTFSLGNQSADAGEIIDEGEYSQSPNGQSNLSYTGVYDSYQNVVSNALQSGRIPLDQRDVIHDYFSSLEP